MEILAHLLQGHTNDKVHEMIGSKDCSKWFKKVSQVKFDGRNTKVAVYYRKCIPYPRNPVKVEMIANNVWASCVLKLVVIG